MQMKGVLLSGLVLAFVLGPAAPVSAISNSLGVRPRIDAVIKPGEKFTGLLQVINLSKTDELRIDIAVIDFGARNETGAPSLLLDQKEPTRWSLKPYMTIA